MQAATLLVEASHEGDSQIASSVTLLESGDVTSEVRFCYKSRSNTCAPLMLRAQLTYNSSVARAVDSAGSVHSVAEVFALLGAPRVQSFSYEYT